MARLNEILVGRFNRGLQKLFGIKGQPPVATLAPEIMPVHAIANGIENRYTEGWQRFAFAAQRGPTAAQTNAVRLRNPAGSNVIAILELLIMGTTNTTELNLSMNPLGVVDLTTPQGGISLDNRQTTGSTIIASFSDASPAIGSSIIRSPNGIATGGQISVISNENQEIIISPGFALTVANITVNTTLYASFFWRERFLEEGERL
jgi:hypothetical protein